MLTQIDVAMLGSWHTLPNPLSQVLIDLRIKHSLWQHFLGFQDRITWFSRDNLSFFPFLSFIESLLGSSLKPILLLGPDPLETFLLSTIICFFLLIARLSDFGVEYLALYATQTSCILFLVKIVTLESMFSYSPISTILTLYFSSTKDFLSFVLLVVEELLSFIESTSSFF